MPACPDGWDCTFVENPPKHTGPWWEGTWGWVTLVLVALMFVALLAFLFNLWAAAREQKRQIAAAEGRRAWRLQMSEQTTMHLELAKHDPATLEFVRRQAEQAEKAGKA